jgi:plasmid stability protein
MALETVEKMITDALADERRTGRLANALRDRAAAHGRSPGEAEVMGAVGFVAEYVEHVPAYLRDGLEAARMVGREGEMSEVVREATEYWMTESDIIPDRLGLLGILDDAYYSLTLMQAVSDRHEEESGRALFSRNLKAANASVRNLIGEPAASQIDMYVGTRLNADPMTQMMRALTSMSAHRGAFPIPHRDGIWGDSTTEEIVEARLGRLGLA